MIVAIIVLWVFQLIGLCTWLIKAYIEEVIYPTRLQFLLLLIPFGGIILLWKFLKKQEDKRS